MHKYSLVTGHTNDRRLSFRSICGYSRLASYVRLPHRKVTAVPSIGPETLVEQLFGNDLRVVPEEERQSQSLAVAINEVAYRRASMHRDGPQELAHNS